MIVDSPGIGETAEMKELVLDYILKACTFIYVINSTCAGGVQDRVSKSCSGDHMSRVVRKPAFCICENKGADCYTDSTIPLLSKSKISSL